MKLKKKGLVIVLCCVVAVIGIAAGAFVVTSNKDVKSSYTVKFELCTDLKTTTVLDREVEPGAFLEEPEVYVTENNEENWGIMGWYREPEYEIQWDFDFDTVESDLTLYAKWETKPLCTVNFYTKESTEPVITTAIRKGLAIRPYNEEFVGREVLGYYVDQAMTEEFDFETKIEEDTNIYVDISDYVYFDAKMMSKWNVCGEQSEVDNYEVSVSLSSDEEILTFTSKNGGYLWLDNLELDMHETSIIEVKMREVNDNYSGAVGGYILGSYTVNGETGVSSVFGMPHTGSLTYARSAQPDEDGFYTYTYNISNFTPGLIYDVMTGIRLDIAGADKYTFEIKNIKTYVDKYAVSAEAFSAKGINFNGLHLNTFSLMEEAETEVLANGDLRFGGPNGAYVYKKELDITLGEEQIIRLTAKGDLKGGNIVLFFFGEYTQDGKRGVSTDFTDEQKITFVPGETDEKGYTTYTADLSTIQGFKLNKVNGLRIDLYGEGTRSVDMKALKSYEPTAEEKKIAKAFYADGLNLRGAHFTTFFTMGDAKGSLLDSGDYSFGGPNGVYLYKKNVDISLDADQKIELKAKGDLKNGKIYLYMYGKYTQKGKSKTTTDFNADHRWEFVPVKTDKEGYTTYALNLNAINGMKFDAIHGLRIDLYGEGTRTIEIASLKSVVPSKEEEEAKKAFVGKGVDFTGVHLARFNVAGNAQTSLLNNGDYKFGGPNGAMIYYDDMEITLKDDQIIEMKAKGDLNNGAIALFFCGDYTINGKAGTVETFVAEHRVTFAAGETDAEGYTTYTADIGSAIEGLKYKVLRGLRIDLYGEDTRVIKIKSVKSVAPSQEEEEAKKAFVGKGVDFTGVHLARFNVAGNAQTSLLNNGDYKFGGPNGAMIYYDDMEITLKDDQIIEMKAKGDLNNGAIALFFCGDYTINGKAGTVETFVAEHRVTFVAGETDAEGYTTYTADIGSAITGLQYDVLRGLRIDLYGEGTRAIEIKSVKSVAASDVTVTYYMGSTSLYETSVKVGERILRPKDSLIAMGHQILGYYSDEACKTTYAFGGIAEENINVYVKLSDYMYFNPAMLKEFNIAAGTVGSATASTELVDGKLEFKAVHGSYIYKTGMNLDVSDTQVIEFTASATVDVARIDLWLFGTYTKDGESYTNTSEDLNLRWFVTPDTTGKFVTYKLDLSESPKATGMVWEKITGLRIDLLLNNVENTGIMNISSIKAVAGMDVLKEDFDKDIDWTYTDVTENTGTVPAQEQGTEEVVESKVELFPNGDAENGTTNWGENEFGSGTDASASYFSHIADPDNSNNTIVAYYSPDVNDGVYYWIPAGAIEVGKTYTASFRYKGDVQFHFFTSGLTDEGDYTLVDDWVTQSAGWKTASYQITATTNTASTIFFFRMATEGGGTFYIDDVSLNYTETTTATTHTQGIGSCIIDGEATEDDNVLYVKDYKKVETSAEIKAGTTYQYSFLIRNDRTKDDFDFDVQVGGTKVADIMSGALDVSAWKEVKGTFTATADATTFGFLRAGKGGVYIDDIVVTKKGEAESEVNTDLVVNGDFENFDYDYTTAWRVQGTTGQMAIVVDPDDSQNRVLQFTASDGNSGVDYNAGKVTGFLEKDKTYIISFRYKGEAQFHIFTQGLTSAGHTLLKDWVEKSASGWMTYTCDITPSIDTTTSEMQFYIKMATATGGTFYIDDFSITEK